MSVIITHASKLATPVVPPGLMLYVPDTEAEAHDETLGYVGGIVGMAVGALVGEAV